MKACVYLGVVAAGLMVLLPGCDRKLDTTPPQIAYGMTECEECRMIVSEEPYAAAAVSVSDGAVRKVVFDDIGCLRDYLRGRPASEAWVGYVHDYTSRQWVRADQAIYLHSRHLRTPMGSQLVACVSEAAAQPVREQFGGDIATFQNLPE